ncbi:non-ribosomal peptide synthetase [Gillisia sp. Hel_I_29]|uniref:non-ribosomal peptide synthetase n=1 Tax=Gillisia sp. Hel_I_29 TaxID=1249975 RepID=UPI000550FD82|nr:non-ribosomal peptide synthetase [Gillisia sp. Hel_I_29]
MDEIIEILTKYKDKNIAISLDKEGVNLKITGNINELTEADKNDLIHSKPFLIKFFKEQEQAKLQIKALAEQANYSLSSSQQRLWVLSQFEGGSSAYNMPSRIFLDGSYDVDLFKRAIYSVVDRHEILRTVFKENSQGEIRQWILERDALGFEIGELDLQGEADIESSVLNYLDNDRMVEFDLAKGPLLRAILLQVSEDRYVFYYNMHHIISDGWSMDVLSRDVFKYYEFYKSGGELDLPALRIQYKDYASWQLSQLSTSIYQGHRDYWTGLLGGDLPVLDLPSSKVRPVIQSHQGQLLRTYISKESTQGLKRFSHQEGGTLFMGLLSSLKALLYRYTGQEDLVVGTPVAGREHSDLEDQIGFYINTLALRNEVRSEDSFEDLFRRVRQRTLDAYEHQGYPFDRLVEDLELRRDTSRNVIYDISVVLQNFEEESTVLEPTEEMVNTVYDDGISVSKNDVEFTFGEQGDYLYLNVGYNTDVYEQEMLEGFIVHYKEFLEKLLSNPEALIGSIDYLAEEERVELLDVFNATAFDYPRDKTVVELFEEQVSKTPEAIAVVYEEERLSYEELNRRSNQLAHYLQAHYTIEPDDLVGIMLPRSSWMIVGILGILKSGGAYVPIDPDYPEDRKSYIISETNLKVLIINSESMFDVLDLETSILAIDIELENYKGDSESGINPPHIANSKDLAYVIYTSGSTGKPKGVMVEHKSIVRLVKGTNYFEIREGDKVLSFSNYAFDGSIFDIFMPLLNGGILVLSSKHIFLNIEKLNELIKQASIDSFFITTVLFNSLVDSELDSLKGLKYVLFGGERVSVKHVRRFRELYPKVNLHHVYGPTENTTFSSWYKVEKIPKLAQTIPIGSGISNSTCYILDEQHHLVPKGVIGEIYLGGEGLARGYLKESDFRSRKFIRSPFKEGQRLYKTGDLGRWTFDGAIEFIERKDNQVKIRGYRIELGDVESELLKNEEIDEVMVLLLEVDNGDKRLVAYFVSKEEQTINGLRKKLRTTLPEYMIPHHFVQIDRFVLNSNGKVDQQRLPDPREIVASTGMEFIAPRNGTEKQIAEIWENLLKHKGISIQDNFFSLGGDSIVIIQVVNKLKQIFNREIDIQRFYQSPTIEELALYLNEEGNDNEILGDLRSEVNQELEELKLEVLEELEDTQNIEDLFPMSDIQKGMIFSSLQDPSLSIYHMQMTFHIPHIDSNIFEKGFSLLIDKHSILRTSFNLNDYREPVQLVHKEISFNIDTIDLQGMPRAKQIEYIEQYLEDERKKPFEESIAPLWRWSVFKISNDSSFYVFQFHHALLDGWSDASLLTELYNVCLSLRITPGFKPALLKSNYKASVVESLVHKRNKGLTEYWKDQMTDYKRLDIFTNENKLESYRKRYDSTYLNKLKSFAEKNNITLRNLFLGSYLFSLYSYTYDNDLTIGVVSNLRPLEEDGDLILGCFLNTLPYRFKHSEDSRISWLSYFKSIETKYWEVRGHDKLTLFNISNIVEERILNGNPFFDVLFNYVDFHVYEGLKQEQVESEEERMAIGGHGPTNTYLNFSVDNTGNNLEVSYALRKKLKAGISLNDIAFTAEAVLNQLITAPESLISKTGILPKEMEDTLLHVFNATAFDYPRDKTVVELFEEQVSKTPEAIAVVYEEERLSYEELNRRSNQLAHYLQAHYTIEPDDLVGIMLPRSSWMIVGILGILKSGGAYVPIDPDYPEDRIAYMLEDSKCKVLLDEEFLDKFNNNNKSDYSTDNLSISLLPSNLAYVIYTSGSTGKPKGVMVEHNSLINLCYWHIKNYDLTESSRATLFSGVGFDALVWEIFPYLLSGGSLYPIENSIRSNIEVLIDFLNTNSITHSYIATSLYNIFSEYSSSLDHSIKVYVGGEALLVTSESENIELYNNYGPTENTVVTSFYKVIEYGNYLAPIGVPISNTEIYILNREGLLQPIGVTGELYIGGAGLARGYLNNELLTKERFVSNPFKEGTRMYKTGDLGRWNSDGTITFLGREDAQVKIRGYRIELGEIESVLLGHADIDEAVVLANDNDGVKELVAYFVSSLDHDSASLRSYLKGFLPDYMLPSYYVAMEGLPLTPNGKIDRRSLPSPEGLEISHGVVYVAPETETQKKLVAIWEAVLGKDKIGIKDDFFELGGHSLNIFRVISKIEKEFQIKTPFKLIFDNPNIDNLSKAISTYYLDHKYETQSINSKINNKVNLFLVPPIMGISSIFFDLTKELESNFNCYGLDYNDLEQNLNSSIEVLSKTFIDNIFNVQKEGEFFILGYSMGGYIAFEIVKQMQFLGYNANLIIIDSYTDVDRTFYFKQTEVDYKEILIKILGKNIVDKMDNSELKNMKDLYTVNFKILANYVIEGNIRGDMLVFEALNNNVAYEMNNWSKFIDGKLNIVDLKGNHYTILNETNYQKIKKELMLLID